MSTKFKISFFIICFLCRNIPETHAQNYNLWRDFLESFECQPASARAAAMGYAQVANGGTIAEARINPATLGLMPQKLQTEFGYSWPSFVDEKARTSFIGAAYKVNPKLAVGVSRFSYSVKEPFFGFLGGSGQNFFPDKFSETYYTGTASYEVMKGLRAGVNLNYFLYALEGAKTEGSLIADAGISYDVKLRQKQAQGKNDRRLRVAASFTNLNMAKTKWNFPNGEPDDVQITSHLYAGASYSCSKDLNKHIYGKSKLVDESSRAIDFLVQFQYINFVNMSLTTEEEVSHKDQNITWGASVGGEVLFLKLLAIRLGYRYEKRNGDDSPFGATANASYPYIKGVTFGTGLNIPVRRLTGSKVPFDLSLDYVHRNKPFKWLKENPHFEELPTTNFNLRLNWDIK